MADEQTPTDALTDLIAAHLCGHSSDGKGFTCNCDIVGVTYISRRQHAAHVAAVVRASGTTGTGDLRNRITAVVALGRTKSPHAVADDVLAAIRQTPASPCGRTHIEGVVCDLPTPHDAWGRPEASGVTLGGTTREPFTHTDDPEAENAVAAALVDRLGYVAFSDRYAIAANVVRWFRNHRPAPAPGAPNPTPPRPQSADNPSAWCVPGQPFNLVPTKPRYPTIPKPNPDATPWGDGATQWSGAGS